jgi:hypothetical protein
VSSQDFINANKRKGIDLTKYTPDGSVNITELPIGESGVLTSNGATSAPSWEACVGYTDEEAQDAVGNILQDSNEIRFTYDDDTPYITAMGKGKGIIFRVKISNINFDNFSIDSFIINNKSLPYTQNSNDSFVEIESNYFKSTESPEIYVDSKNKVIKEIDDSIITDQNFYPSWVIITSKNKKIKLIIANYQKTQ